MGVNTANSITTISFRICFYTEPDDVLYFLLEFNFSYFSYYVVIKSEKLKITNLELPNSE